MADEGEGWQPSAKRAGDAVLRRREARGYKTRGQFAKATGLTIKTLGEIERGVRPSYNKSTYATLDRVLQWEPGTFEALLSGGGAPETEPEPVDLAAELMTFEGLVGNLHRLDPGILAALLHRSGVGPEGRWRAVQALRAVAVEQLRANWQALAEVIVAEGGAVDVDTWPGWLSAPQMVEELRKGK